MICLCPSCHLWCRCTRISLFQRCRKLNLFRHTVIYYIVRIETNIWKISKWDIHVGLCHMVTPKEDSFSSHLSMSAESTENSHCYKSTKFLTTLVSWSHKDPRGGFIPVLSNRRRGPFLKKRKEITERKASQGKPLQTEENQIRREIGNEIFFTKNKRVKGKIRKRQSKKPSFRVLSHSSLYDSSGIWTLNAAYLKLW